MRTSLTPKLKRSAEGTHKKAMVCIMMLLFSIPIFAVDGQITTWSATVKLALDAAVGLFAVVGGFLVFLQYMQGNEQAQKNLIRFVIGMGIFGLAELLVATFI
ncbi:MAG: hypothetical protein AAFO99_14660 [Bacteroidota bacterium]